jgi:hypothetical protein
MTMRSAITLASLFAAAAAACTANPMSQQDCSTGQCDTPKGPLDQLCKNSRVNAMDSNRPQFTPNGVRWSCKDVNGVSASSNTSDDRGQEYCEYFTLLHTAGVPSIIMDATNNPVFCDANTPCASGTCDPNISSCVTATTVDTSQAASVLGKNTNGSTVTPLDPTLSAGQLAWLSQNPSQKVGTCVFTSWHADIDRTISSTETIEGYGLNDTTPSSSNLLFRMDVGFNSNGAAQQLVSDCLKPGNAKITDGYTRGCFMTGSVGLPWRKSDPSVCTMAMRIAECGCTVTPNDGTNTKLDLSNANDLARAQDLFVPKARRGFTLGTWDGVGLLPTGCRYVRTGDTTSLTVDGRQVDDPNADQTIVACDLKGSHITQATAKDPKEACRVTYGDEVVVHVRVPTPTMATVSCDMTQPKCAGVPWDFANL